MPNRDKHSILEKIVVAFCVYTQFLAQKEISQLDSVHRNEQRASLTTKLQARTVDK